MIVTNAKYIKSLYAETNDSIEATIDGQLMFVPLDPANRHYAAILLWVADGNTITAAGG